MQYDIKAESIKLKQSVSCLITTKRFEKVEMKCHFPKENILNDHNPHLFPCLIYRPQRAASIHGQWIKVPCGYFTDFVSELSDDGKCIRKDTVL